MPLNRGLNRFSSPAQPGGFPWSSLIHGANPVAMRPPAAPWNAGLFFLATDIAGGTLYRSTGTVWVACGSGVTGAGLPAGLTTEIQYNDAGAFGANAGLFFNVPALHMTVPGLTVTQDMIFNSTINPGSLGTSQNDWNPTGLSTAYTINIVPTANINITGIVGQAIGSIRLLKNIGNFTITLVMGSGSSSAANRFTGTLNDTVIPKGGAAEIQYETGSLWRVVRLFDNESATIRTLVKGGTGADLSGTGGANQFVRQNSAGGAFTVGAIASGDIVTGVLPGGNWITATTSGPSVLGGTYSITADATWQDVTNGGTPCEITLTVGTWDVSYTARAVGIVTAGTGHILAHLRNTTDSADIANSEGAATRVSFPQSPAANGGSVTVRMPITVASTKVIRMQAWRDTGPTWGTCDIRSDTQGRTSLFAVRIS